MRQSLLLVAPLSALLLQCSNVSRPDAQSSSTKSPPPATSVSARANDSGATEAELEVAVRDGEGAEEEILRRRA